ncbi:hypothetical protein DQ240_22990 [Blastococcus sp. TF02A-26]|nr:hypothetical protein DQ240_22990 [Blastococcus sp. TF02A-26]
MEGMQALLEEVRSDVMPFAVAMASLGHTIAVRADILPSFEHYLCSAVAISADLAADPQAPLRVARWLDVT